MFLLAVSFLLSLSIFPGCFFFSEPVHSSTAAAVEAMFRAQATPLRLGPDRTQFLTSVMMHIAIYWFRAKQKEWVDIHLQRNNSNVIAVGSAERA